MDGSDGYAEESVDVEVAFHRLPSSRVCWTRTVLSGRDSQSHSHRLRLSCPVRAPLVSGVACFVSSDGDGDRDQWDLFWDRRMDGWMDGLVGG